MTAQCKFNYKSLDELREDISRLGLEEKIPLSEDLSILSTGLQIPGGPYVPNRFAVHPMEAPDIGIQRFHGMNMSRQFLNLLGNKCILH